MNTDKIAETLRLDPVPWNDLRERRVLGDIHQQLSASWTPSQATSLQTSFNQWVQRKSILAAAAILLLCLGAFIGARLFSTSSATQQTRDKTMAIGSVPDADSYSTLEIKGLGETVLSPSARMMLVKEKPKTKFT